MLNYNKTSLLKDFELPSGNVFSGPLTLLHIPRCGVAPAQGLILSSNKITLSTLQYAELVTKFTDAGYSVERAEDFANSFESPATLRVGLIANQKAISITRNQFEHPISASKLPIDDDEWVVYEAIELSKIFDLNATVSNDYVKSLADHPKITGKGWEVVSPSIVSGLPSDGILTQVHSNMYASSSVYGFASQFIQSGPSAWFQTASATHVYVAIPVGKYTDGYGTKYVSILVRRVRTIHDRNVALVAIAPKSPARLEHRIGLLGVGLNRTMLTPRLVAKGLTDTAHYWGDGHGDAMESFHGGTWPAPVYSSVVDEIETDWPEMVFPVAKSIGADGNVFVSRRLYVYGWLDAPRSCSWTYDRLVTTQDGDTTVINVEATTSLYNYEDGQLRRFLTQLVDSGQYTGVDLVKLTEARDAIPDTWNSSIHVMSRTTPYNLSQNVETTLPMAVYAEDNGGDARAIVLAESPTITLGQVADKARLRKSIPSICLMPKGDQVTGLFGNEIISFTTSAPGVYAFTMTQFGQPYEGGVDEMMVATALGASWVLIGMTEAAIAGHYFNGATTKAEAMTWVSAGEIASYHDPVYRVDDYHCWGRWNGWPATTGADLARLTVNQLLGDRVNTANTLYAMSVWSVGRRLRNTYTSFEELITGEDAKVVPNVTLRPRKGWDTTQVSTTLFYDNEEVALATTAVAGAMCIGEVPNSTKQGAFSFEILANPNNSDIYGVSISTNKYARHRAIRIWSGAAEGFAFNEGSMTPAVVGDVITFAVDQNTTLSKLRVYKNGVFQAAWHIPYDDSYYPHWEFGSVGGEIRLDLRPVFKPLASVDWDALP